MPQALIEPTRRYSVAEYFEIDTSPDHKYEYWAGELIDMAGGSETQGLIAANVVGSLNLRLRSVDCRVYGSEVRIQVHRTVRYVYPDASVVCGPREFNPDAPSKTTLTNPKLIVEVLSPSTEMHDRSDKFADYLRCASLEEYVMVLQNRAKVECYFRQGDGTWLLSFFEGVHATAKLRSVGVDLPLSEVYAKVDLPPRVEEDADLAACGSAGGQ